MPFLTDDEPTPAPVPMKPVQKPAPVLVKKASEPQPASEQAPEQNARNAKSTTPKAHKNTSESKASEQKREVTVIVNEGELTTKYIKWLIQQQAKDYPELRVLITKLKRRKKKGTFASDTAEVMAGFFHYLRAQKLAFTLSQK